MYSLKPFFITLYFLMTKKLPQINIHVIKVLFANFAFNILSLYSNKWISHTNFSTAVVLNILFMALKSNGLSHKDVFTYHSYVHN